MNGGSPVDTRRNAVTLRSLVVAMLLLASASFQGQQSAQQKDENPYTLRVFTNLMEVPALVLGPNNQPLPLLEAARFSIRLDAGPRFAPSYVRLEGEDPLSLAILIDLTSTPKAFLPALRDALPTLAAGLHPKDRVSLYVLDCALVRSADNVSAIPEALSSAFDDALASADLHSGKKKMAACSGNVRLWDSIAYIVKRVAALPGRRAVVISGYGYDGKSSTSPSRIRVYAASHSIAIFDMSYDSYGDTFQTANDIALRGLCELTGGTVLRAFSAREIAKTLPRFVDLLRGRYILEFRRPANATAGMHQVFVTLPKTAATIHVAGTTVAMPTAEELSGPELVPSTRTPTAEQASPQ